MVDLTIQTGCIQVLVSLAKIHSAKLRGCFEKWQDAVRWRVEMKTRCCRMLARMQHRHLAIFMDTWRVAGIKARHMRWYSSFQNLYSLLMTFFPNWKSGALQQSSMAVLQHYP